MNNFFFDAFWPNWWRMFLPTRNNQSTILVMDSIDEEINICRCCYFSLRNIRGPFDFLPGKQLTSSIILPFEDRVLQNDSILELFFYTYDNDVTEIIMASIDVPLHIFSDRQNKIVKPGAVYQVRIRNLQEFIFSPQLQSLARIPLDIRYSEIGSLTLQQWENSQRREASQILEQFPELALGRIDGQNNRFL